MAGTTRVPTIAARLALPLLLEWKRRGESAPALLDRLGVDEAHLRRLDARIALELFSDMHAACVAGTSDPGFALAALATLEPSAFPPVLHLVSSQVTLLEGIGFVQPFIGSMIDELELEVVIGPGVSHARFRRAGEPLSPPAFAEYFLAMLWTFVRRVAPPSPPPLAVLLAHRYPRHGEGLADFFGSEIKFGASHVGFEFRLPNIEIPIPTADPELGKVLAATADRWATSAGTELRVRDRARHFLATNLAGDEAIGARLAKAMHLAERTLRRKLEEEGTSLRALVDEVRRERAIELLTDGTLGLDAIAVELGYESASSFGRAFRAWTGETPTEFARRATGGPAGA